MHRPHRPARRRASSAFTLIELLVVIAIIAILAAILFPVFAQAREKARQSTCQSNLKQIGLAMMQYVQDYDETYPGIWQQNGTGGSSGGCTSASEPDPDYTWRYVLAPYVKNVQVYKCPSNRFSDEDRFWRPGYISGTPDDIYYPNDYVPNDRVMKQPSWTGSCGWGNSSLPMNNIQEPASIILLAEWRARPMEAGYHRIPFGPSGSTRPQDRFTTDFQSVAPTEGFFQTHAKMVQFAFCDGHVKAMRLPATLVPNDLWLSGETLAVRQDLATRASIRAEYK